MDLEIKRFEEQAARDRRDQAFSDDLKREYLAAGGTEDGWKKGRSEIIESARRQQAITAATKEKDPAIAWQQGLLRQAGSGRRQGNFVIKQGGE